MDKTCDSLQHSKSLALWKNSVKRPKKVSMRTPTLVEETFYKDLITELIRERERQGLSQEELNNDIGVSSGLVSKWESGVRLPSSFYIMCWCLALDLKLVTAKVN